MKPLIKDLPKLYIEEPNLKSLKDLIKSGYDKNGIRFVETYYDKNYKNVQCLNDKRRSFEDLLAVSKTYFPKTTQVQLMNVLKDLDILWYYCSHVKKIVFHHAGNFNLYDNSFQKYRDYHQNVIYADSTYSLNDLNKIYNKL